MSAQEIRLSGALGRMCGRRHFVHLDSKTPAEATRWLITQFPEARRYLAHAKEQGIVFAVFRGKQRENIGVEHMNEPGGKVICFAPVIAGSKRAGALQTIIGIILIAVSFIPGFQALATVGIGLVAGGVVQMLTPIPKLGKSADSAGNQASSMFNGPINTTAQGGCVPVAYGRVRVGSAVISAGMVAEDYSSATSNIGLGTHGGNFKSTPFDEDPA